MGAAFRILLRLGAACLPLLAAQPARAGAAIAWRLENPFRLFKDPAHTAMHLKAYEALDAADKRNTPVLAGEQALAIATGGRGWAERMFSDTCYDEANGAFSGCKDYLLPRSHRVVLRLDAGAAASNGDCEWSVEPLDGHSPPESRRAPCEQTVTIEVPYPAGARVAVRPSAGVEAAPVDVKVQDILVLALGDSFGAGEGNPDYPEKYNDARSVDYGEVDLAATDQHLRLEGYPAREGAWKDINGQDFDGAGAGARWWDRECHRSLYSHQLRAALQLAIENPRRAVTFLSYSCSGAEVAQGILLRKPVRECMPGQAGTVGGQLSAASEDLCRRPDRDRLMPQAIINRMPELARLDEEDMKVTRCEKSSRSDLSQPQLKRPVDLVLLSIGGNDVGFVSVLSDAMLSERSVYRLLGQPVGAVFGPDKARANLKLLQQRLDALHFDLSLSLGLPLREGAQDRIVLAAYPHMGFREDGATPCSGQAGMEVFPPFRLNPDKVRGAEDFADELNLILSSTSKFGWRLARGFDADFRSHGLCARDAGGEESVESLAFPRRAGGAWRPFPPSAWRPYAPRRRWFRTPNDSFLAANMHARKLANFGLQCSVVFSSALSLARRHWRPFQVFLASTYGGAFHPTAEGQARIADEVVKEARTILDRRP